MGTKNGVTLASMGYLEKVAYAQSLIKRYSDKYPAKLAVGCSFGKDSMVTLHLALDINPKLPVFSVLADTEFDETYKFIIEVVKDWELDYTEYGFQQEDGFRDNLTLCCGRPKVEKTKEALKRFNAWISGVRKTEGITRADFQYVEEKDGLVKINPILEFTELDIWRYTALNRLPINPKYAEGYRSLGCKFCSSPEEDGNETERDGRWRSSSKARGECGIHTRSLR